jgi:hypothetical protein
MGHLNMTELFEFPPTLTDVPSDFLSDRPKIGGAEHCPEECPSPLLPEESEGVSAAL